MRYPNEAASKSLYISKRHSIFQGESVLSISSSWVNFPNLKRKTCLFRPPGQIKNPIEYSKTTTRKKSYSASVWFPKSSQFCMFKRIKICYFGVRKFGLIGDLIQFLKSAANKTLILYLVNFFSEVRWALRKRDRRIIPIVQPKMK